MDYLKAPNKRPINLYSINRAKLKEKINNLQDLETLYCKYENQYYYITKNRLLLDKQNKEVIGKWDLFNRKLLLNSSS